MHELGIAQDLFQIIKEKAKANNITSVSEVRVRLGVASGIEKGLLVHSFVDHLFPGSIADGATVEITNEPIRAVCKNCGGQIDIGDDPVMNCPACKSYSIEIIQGKDIYIEEIRGV